MTHFRPSATQENAKEWQKHPRRGAGGRKMTYFGPSATQENAKAWENIHVEALEAENDALRTQRDPRERQGVAETSTSRRWRREMTHESAESSLSRRLRRTSTTSRRPRLASDAGRPDRRLRQARSTRSCDSAPIHGSSVYTRCCPPASHCAPSSDPRL